MTCCGVHRFTMESRTRRVCSCPITGKHVGTPTTRQLADSAVHRRTVVVEADTIHGSLIRLPGLEATITDVLLRVEFADGSTSSAHH